MRSTRMVLWVAALVGLAACGEESPLELGALLPGGGIRTAEFVFDGQDFLEWDSVRTGFVRPYQAAFIAVANQYGGELDATGLIRLHPLPSSVNYQNKSGELVVDSVPDRLDGMLILRLDTAQLRQSALTEAEVALYEVAEDWDLASANWSNRIDTDKDQSPWAEPGGTGTRLLDRSTIVPGDTIVFFDVDSAALNSLSDPLGQERGLMIRAETPGTMIEMRAASLHFKIRPRERPDTLLTDSVFMSAKTFLLSQELDRTRDPLEPLYIGGIPGTRTYLRFKEGIDELRVPCPEGPSGCTVPLSDVAINYAGFLLQPVAAQPGFGVRDTATFISRTILQIAGVPLSRTPLGGQLTDPVRSPPGAGAGPEQPVEVPATMLLRALATPGDSVRANAARTITLLGSPEGAQLGVSAFGSLASGPDLAPKLRLIYSVTKEVEVQ